MNNISFFSSYSVNKKMPLKKKKTKLKKGKSFPSASSKFENKMGNIYIEDTQVRWMYLALISMQ